MSINYPLVVRNLLLAALLLVIPSGVWGAPEYRPEKAKRALNTDQYSLSIQKNNRVDIHQMDGFPVLIGAYPSIATAEKGTRPLKVVYSKSSRVSVRNTLGRGNGLQFKTDECEWVIAAYPGQPFVTVALTYTNTGRKPVQVTALSPWDIGGKGKGTLFVGRDKTAQTVLMGNATTDAPDGTLTHREAESPGHISAWNPISQEGIVAGFLGQVGYPSSVAFRDSEDANGAVFGRFQARTTFEPPITLAPGESLQADLFYFAFGERDVAEGLERYIDAARKMAPFPRLSERFYRGWNAGARPDIDAETIRLVMEGLAGTARQRGWGHVHLGTAWMADPNSLARDIQRFPEDLSSLAAHGHALGLSIGLTIPVGVENEEGTVAFIRQCQAEGIDSVELSLMGSEGARVAVRSLYAALEASGTRGASLPPVVRPVASVPLPFGAVGPASRTYYLPASGDPGLTAPGFRHEVDLAGLSDEQFITAVSRTALLGQPLRTTLPFSAQTPFRQAVLGRISLSTAQTARPVDLLGDVPPEVWYRPLKSSVGAWTIAGLFNWGAAPGHVTQMPLERLGLNNNVRYTVYDYWAGQYLGLIENTLKVEVPLDGVRLLGLRYAEQRPMLVASNRDYTQGANDQTEITWDHASQTLSGRMEGVGDFMHLLTFYVPEPYILKSVEASEKVLSQVADGPSVKIAFRPALRGEIRWRLSF